MTDNTESKLRAIDDYIQGLFPPDDALTQALESSEREGLPQINVSPNQGRLLHMIALMCGARKVLEIGTLGGFSTINLARALPAGGRLITLEYSPKHAEVARANIERAGLADVVEVRVGAALDTLPEIERAGEGPFDLFFIDADKENYPAYLDWAIRLSRPGSVILSDNLIRDGIVMNPPADDSAAQAISRFNRDLAENPRLQSIILPIVREYTDGLGISVVR
jgi:caffeoyl-CoA O-methyltransferase